MLNTHRRVFSQSFSVDEQTSIKSRESGAECRILSLLSVLEQLRKYPETSLNVQDVSELVR